MDKNLYIERKKMQRQLKGIYRKEYRSIQKLLAQDMMENDSMQEVDLGVLNLFVQAQIDGSLPQDIYGGSKEEFYLTLLMESESFSLNERLRLKKSDRIINGWMILVLMATLLFILVLNSDFYQIKRNGFLFFQKNGFVIQESEVLKDEISFELDVQDLSKNFNKVIYQSDAGKIVLEGVFREDENIILRFRSEGVLKEKSGTLVSAVRHLYDENGASRFVMNATCSFTLNNHIYLCAEADMSGLTKSGDEFSFELIRASDFVQGEFKEKEALENSESVQITIKDLIKITWK